MPQQVLDCDPLLAVVVQLGKEPDDAILEPELALLDQQHDRRRRGHGLGERGHVEDRVAGHWLGRRLDGPAAGDVYVSDRSPPSHQHHRARHDTPFDGPVDGPVDPPQPRLVKAQAGRRRLWASDHHPGLWGSPSARQAEPEPSGYEAWPWQNSQQDVTGMIERAWHMIAGRGADVHTAPHLDGKAARPVHTHSRRALSGTIAVAFEMRVFFGVLAEHRRFPEELEGKRLNSFPALRGNAFSDALRPLARPCPRGPGTRSASRLNSPSARGRGLDDGGRGRDRSRGDRPGLVGPGAPFALCSPLVIGDAGVLRKALSLVGSTAKIQIIDQPEEAEPLRRLVPCLAPSSASDLGSLADLAPGRVDARAGRAAYEYLIAAIDLALAGQIDAITTLPLNKEVAPPGRHRASGPHRDPRRALRHARPRHDALPGGRCRMTGQRPIRPGLGVVHVTLHVALQAGLRAALGRRRRVEDSPGRPGDAALDRRPALRAWPSRRSIPMRASTGSSATRRSGSSGRRSRSPGPRASTSTGPFPNDTLFHHALSGDFDAVVAMYHDQGHIALKTAGFHRAVNVTLGLPIVRTSVAHGTAFDIAWQGRRRPVQPDRGRPRGGEARGRTGSEFRDILPHRRTISTLTQSVSIVPGQMERISGSVQPRSGSASSTSRIRLWPGAIERSRGKGCDRTDRQRSAIRPDTGLGIAPDRSLAGDDDRAGGEAAGDVFDLEIGLVRQVAGQRRGDDQTGRVANRELGVQVQEAGRLVTGRVFACRAGPTGRWPRPAARRQAPAARRPRAAGRTRS